MNKLCSFLLMLRSYALQSGRLRLTSCSLIYQLRADFLTSLTLSPLNFKWGNNIRLSDLL